MIASRDIINANNQGMNRNFEINKNEYDNGQNSDHEFRGISYLNRNNQRNENLNTNQNDGSLGAQDGGFLNNNNNDLFGAQNYAINTLTQDNYNNYNFNINADNNGFNQNIDQYYPMFANGAGNDCKLFWSH